MISLKFLWKSSTTMGFFVLPVTLIIIFLHSSKSAVGAPAHFVWFWLYYSSNNLPPVAPVRGSSMLSWRHPYFKPLYSLGPITVFGRFTEPNTDHLSKGFLRHGQLAASALLEPTTFWDASNLLVRSEKVLKLFP